MSTTDIDNTITETFYILLTKGLKIGSPMPTPRACYIITRATRSGNFMISTKIRPSDDSLALVPEVIRTLKISDYTKSIARFQRIMREIPTQYMGVEDLYGRETSIRHVTDVLASKDLHVPGTQKPKEPHPTEEQKAMFDEALEIIENWVRVQGPSSKYD